MYSVGWTVMDGLIYSNHPFPAAKHPHKTSTISLEVEFLNELLPAYQKGLQFAQHKLKDNIETWGSVHHNFGCDTTLPQ